MWHRVGERAATPYITPTIKHGRGSIMLLSFYKVGILHQGKLNQTDNQSILQHHTIPSGTQLVSQGFVLMQDNDPQHTSKLYQRYIKNKKEQHVLQLMSWPMQSTELNPIELVWDELNSSQVQLASGNSFRKAEQNYLQSTSSLWWKECQDSVKQW